MTSVVADTQAIVWWLTSPEVLSPEAAEAMDAAQESDSDIVVSAISLVELRYLVEKSRIEETVFDAVLGALLAADSPVSLAPLDLPVAVAVSSVPRDEVPDLPDRVVAATALSRNLAIVTSDRDLRGSHLATIW